MSTWAGRTPTADECRDILEKHARWNRGDGGERANLSGAKLSGADLSGANLSGADLPGADLSGAYLSRAYLSGANLYGADLSGADLSGAYLSRAYLSGANLYGADLSRAYLSRAYLYGANLSRAYLSRAYLSGADLSGANLSGADLSGADLSGADLSQATGDLPIYRFQIVPEAGAFIGWKKLQNGLIAQLEIPATAGRVGGLVGRKCRASKARVLAIWSGDKRVLEGFSLHVSSLVYRVGEGVAPADGWCDDPRVECAAGIHFYITRREAEEYE